MRITPLFLALSLCLSTPLAASAQAVAISASHKTGAVGTGTGKNKNSAGKAAKADCKSANAGRACGYWYWTRPTSHMVMVRCTYPIGTRKGGEHAVQGGHSSESLSAAKAKAYKELAKKLSHFGLRASDKNCDTIASFSKGRFRKN